MTQLQRSFRREMNDFVSRISDRTCNFPQVSGAAFTKARAKFKHGAFKELSTLLVDSFYESGPHKKDWRGMRLLACDGSNVELPNSEEIEARFGIHSVRSDGKKISMGTLCELYDPLNNLCIAGKLDGFKVSETALLWDILKEQSFGKGDVFICDRYFYHIALMLYLHQIGADFCFRIKKSSNQVKALKAAGKQDGFFDIKLGRESKKLAAEVGVTEHTAKCRVSIIELDNGEEEYLLTSFLDPVQVSLADLKELYFLRWGIEEHYKKLKHRVCIENFSGKTVESIYQDFYAKLFIINLTCTLIHPVDHLLSEQPKKKHVHKVNFTDALARLKYVPIKLFLEKKVLGVIQTLHLDFLKSTIPIRKGRRTKRIHLYKRKYPQNYKPA